MYGIPDHARTWTTRHDDRAGWPQGPWQDEPDKVSWTDKDTGRPCLIVRNRLGALCGYVAVDPGHPLHGADYDSYSGDGRMDAWEAQHGPVAAHGGLTYADRCQETEDEASGICHVPEPGAPDDVWWFGFDCAHSGDEVPGMLAYGTGLGGRYRTVGYVARRCEDLAASLTADERAS